MWKIYWIIWWKDISVRIYLKSWLESTYLRMRRLWESGGSMTQMFTMTTNLKRIINFEKNGNQWNLKSRNKSENMRPPLCSKILGYCPLFSQSSFRFLKKDLLQSSRLMEQKSIIPIKLMESKFLSKLISLILRSRKWSYWLSSQKSIHSWAMKASRELPINNIWDSIFEILSFDTTHAKHPMGLKSTCT